MKRQSSAKLLTLTAWFPRSNERGSIEAPQGLIYGTIVRWFPRSNERGSIETQTYMPQAAQEYISFHVRMNVAQLKRKWHGLDGRRLCGFPRSNERGSIEAAFGGLVSFSHDRFPRSNERGSIEAILLLKLSILN